MGYFDDKNNVNEYIRIAEGYDGRDLIERLKEYLPHGSKVLELGMGPGTDLEILQQSFQVTGSDSSQVFVDRYLKLHPQSDILQLDAITIRTDRKFDSIYSNKVLHHLTKQELELS